jgi:glycosyltransferase involved in cell wall biosynthesis
MGPEQWPLVSIITVVYNGERYIADAIRSVQRQSWPNIQYIVVDGGSTDNTLNIVKSFGSVITDLITEKDEGISDAFNKGLLRARGEFIGIINADDWYEDGAVARAVKAMENADVVYGDLLYWKDEHPDFIAKADHRLLTREMTVNHPTVFVRKSCYDRFGGFDKRYRSAMDYDLLLRLLVNGCRFEHIPEVVANMRWGGVSDNRWMMGVKETLAIKNKYLERRRFLNRMYFFKQIVAIGLPRYMQKIGLGPLVKAYRRSASAKHSSNRLTI